MSSSFSGSIEELIKKGTDLFLKKNFLETYNIGNVIIKQDPKNPNGWNLVGWVLFENKQFRESIKCLKQALKYSSYDTRIDKSVISTNISKAYLEIKDYQNAKIILEELVEKFPLNSELWKELGNSFIGLTNYSKGLKCFNEAFNLDPNNRILIYNIAHAYYKIGDNINALEQINKFFDPSNPDEFVFILKSAILIELGELDQAKKTLEIVDKISQRNQDYWVLLGDLYSKAGNEAQAIEYYWKSLSIDKTNPDVWYKIGSLMLNIDDISGAISAFVTSTKIKEKTKSLIMLSEAFRRKKSYQDAYKVINRGLTKEPNNEHLLLQFSKILSDYKDYEKAIEYCLKAISQNNKDPEAWNILGNNYMDLKMYNESKQALSRSLILDENRYTVWLSLGHLYRRTEEFINAIKYYKRGIELYPNSSGIWQGLGNAYLGNNNFKDAEEAYKKAIDYDSKNSAAYFGLGNLYLITKKLKTSLDAYKYSIKLNNYVEAWRGVALVHLRWQRYDEAVLYLARYDQILTSKNINNEHWDDFFEVFSRTEATFFSYRFISEHIDWKNYHKYHGLYLENQKFNEVQIFLESLESSYKNNFPSNYLLIKALINFHFKDYVLAYELFDSYLDDYINRDNMLIQYYLLRSAFQVNKIFEDYNAIEKYAKTKAIEYLNKIDHSERRDIYYSGMILFFLNEPEKAIIFFENMPDFLPAKIMKIYCEYNLDKSGINNIETLLTAISESEWEEYFTNKKLDLGEDPLLYIRRVCYKKELIEHSDILDHFKNDHKVINSRFKKSFDEEVIVKLSKSSYEDLVINLNERVESYKQTLRIKVSENESFFETFGSLKSVELERKIGNSIMEISKNEISDESLILFLNTITYFHLDNTIEASQKITLIYWLYAIFYRSKGYKKLTSQIIASILSLSFAYLVSPYLGAIYYLINTIPLLEEGTSILIGKAVKEIVEGDDFPLTYDKFREQIEDYIDK